MEIVWTLALIISAYGLLYKLLIAQTLILLAGNMAAWYKPRRRHSSGHHRSRVVLFVRASPLHFGTEAIR